MSSASAAPPEQLGPMRFDEFMRWALYHPTSGYYRRRDPFGTEGDFFTASQLQPLFGRLISAEAQDLCPGLPVFELGPGRREMANAFSPLYSGIEYAESLPGDLTGFVFANEFFDALPVRAAIRLSGILYELLVDKSTDSFQWKVGPVLDDEASDYVRRYWPHMPDGGRCEIALEALGWIDRLASRMQSGCVLIVDYGFTTPETVRFPAGTLLSYRRHLASDDVLSCPGDRDITSHVPFDALRHCAVRAGFDIVRFETLAELTLRVLQRGPWTPSAWRERQQLKSILIGMGETFRCLLLKKRLPAPPPRERS